MLITAWSGRVAADTSKIAAHGHSGSPKQVTPGKRKLCCGYPLSEPLGFALRFYWLAMQASPADTLGEPEQDIYTSDGFYFGTFPESFVSALRMEGSGLLADGRVVNYDGRCGYGVGTCFEQLDRATHPYGRGAGRRPLVPFRSVAVDPRVIAIGEPLYIPELDGIRLPDGTVHDGCVRADDTGSAIKRRKIDFFVVSFENFRLLLWELWGVDRITPHVEDPRCQYLREP
jgi:3D (Asp-Asp-Asp) domain-containing protein